MDLQYYSSVNAVLLNERWMKQIKNYGFCTNSSDNISRKYIYKNLFFTIIEFPSISSALQLFWRYFWCATFLVHALHHGSSRIERKKSVYPRINCIMQMVILWVFLASRVLRHGYKILSEIEVEISREILFCSSSKNDRFIISINQKLCL